MDREPSAAAVALCHEVGSGAHQLPGVECRCCAIIQRALDAARLEERRKVWGEARPYLMHTHSGCREKTCMCGLDNLRARAEEEQR